MGKAAQKDLDLKKPLHRHLKYNLRQYYLKIKSLQGDPHYIAMGIAVGVFVGVTPTFPFHTLLAVVLAFILRGSKPAAVISVWFGNPLTMPLFYFLSYKVGNFILGYTSPFDAKYESLYELLNLGWEVTAAMLIGGAIIALPPAVGIYFISLFAFRTLRKRRAAQSNLS